MMSESNVGINVFSTPTSSSRLSPLARPFTISNPCNRRESFDPLLGSSSLSTSCVDQPFPFLSLGGQSHGYYANLSNTANSITAFPCVDDDFDFEPNSRFAYYPLEESPVSTHFTLHSHLSSQSQTSFIPSSSSLGNVGYNGGVPGTATNQQGREFPHKIDLIGSAGFGLLSCNNLLEQGTTVEGSELVRETLSVLHGKGSMVKGKANQVIPEKDKLQSESSIFQLDNSEVNLLNKCMTKALSASLDMSFSSIAQDTHGHLSYSSPLMTWSHCDPTIITEGRCFPHFGSHSAQIFKTSSASSNPPIVKPVALEYVAPPCIDAVSKRDGNLFPSMMDAGEVRNPLDKAACHGRVVIENIKKGNVVELALPETKNPSIMAKSKLQIACPNVPKDLTLEQHNVKGGIPVDKSSTNHDDSDIDSPCWKGTQAYRSPFRDFMPVNLEESKGQSAVARVSVPLKSESSKNEKVARNNLNPLAPVFIPGNSKQKMDYHQKECHEDGSSSSQKIAASAIDSLSVEPMLTDFVKVSTYPTERIKDIARKEHGIPKKSFIGSALNSSCIFQPYLKEEYVTSESQLVRGTSHTGSMEGITEATHNWLDSVEDIVQNGSNTSISFLPTEIALNSHSIGGGLSSDFTERLEEPSKSTPSKLDVKLIINTIQYLSELLSQKSLFDLGSLSEHDHDKLLNVINNLYVVIRNKAGQMAVRPQLNDICSLYGQRPADHHQVMKMKDKAVLHDQEMHKKSAPIFSSRMQYSFHQNSDDEGFSKGEDIDEFKIPVIEKDPKAIHSIEHELPLEVLFYRNLWHEAKAALSTMKHHKGISCT